MKQSLQIVLWGLEHIIKSRFPMIPFAARTVINGPARTPITDQIIIKDFDCFRPMEEAEVWWFEIVEESIDWRRLGDEGGDKKPPAKRMGNEGDKKAPAKRARS